MDRLTEIRQRTEAGGPVRRIDMKYLLSEVDRLTAALTESQRREQAAVEDLTKLATKPITPCHSCSKTCLFPASLAPELQPATWCRDLEWRGPQAGKGAAPNE